MLNKHIGKLYDRNDDEFATKLQRIKTKTLFKNGDEANLQITLLSITKTKVSIAVLFVLILLVLIEYDYYSSKLKSLE